MGPFWLLLFVLLSDKKLNYPPIGYYGNELNIPDDSYYYSASKFITFNSLGWGYYLNGSLVIDEITFWFYLNFLTDFLGIYCLFKVSSIDKNHGWLTIYFLRLTMSLTLVEDYYCYCCYYYYYPI